MYLSGMLCRVECITEGKSCVFYRSCGPRAAFIKGMITRRKISKWRYRRVNNGEKSLDPLEQYFRLLKVYLLTGFKCWYCGCDMSFMAGSPVPKDHYTFDHRIPLCEGGSNLMDNMVICCWKCNQEKSHKEGGSNGETKK